MKKHDVVKRVTSSLLAAALLLQSLYFDGVTVHADTDRTDINLSAISSDVHLFTNLKFMAGSDTVENGTGSYLLYGNASENTVYVGNETYDGVRYQSSQNIDIASYGANIDSLVLNAVGASAAKQVLIDVTAASTFTDVTIAEDANVVITADAALTLGTVTLGEDATLTIQADSNTVTISSITGTGTCNLQGSSYSVGTITVKDLALTDCTLTGTADSVVTATDSVTIDDATVNTCKLVGYASDATGAKTLTVTGTTKFTNVTNVGAEETCPANITIDGSFSLTDSNAIEDFNLNYYAGTDVLSAESTWPVSYRVRFTDGLAAANASTIGCHAANGDYTSGTIELPKYSVTGYGYAGWVMEGTTTAITHLTSGIRDDQNLTVKLEAGTVSITYDLMFDPSASSCDDYESITRTSSATAQLGEEITLSAPSRFGYRFTGWKVVTGKVNDVYEDDYTVAMTDADTTDGYSINFEAQWEAVRFPFKVMISGIDESSVGIIVAGTNYDSIAEFAASNSHVNWIAGDSMLQFDENIAYGESLEDFFARMGIDGAIELYDKTEGTSKQDFLGWVTQTGSSATLDSTYEIDSLFVKPEGTTLSAYQSQLLNTPVFISATWGTASYTVTTTVDSNWEFLVDGAVQSLTADSSGNATVTVAYGSKITWRYNISKTANFSGWHFTSTTSTFTAPSEETYASSNKYISFSTTMPSGNVVATYTNLASSPVYVDISKSDITLADSVTSPSGREVNGFWYSIDMNSQKAAELTLKDADGVTLTVNRMSPLFQDADKGYFYEYSKTANLYITSRNLDTTNQLTLVSARSTYFRDCSLVARAEYSANFVDRKAYGTLLEYKTYGSGNLTGKTLAGKEWGECGNIVISNQITKTYTTKLYFYGNYNTVASILSSNCRAAADYNGSTNCLYMYGESMAKSTLELGSVIWLGYLQIQSLTINEYDNTKHAANPDNLEYITYTNSYKESAAHLLCYTITLNAKDKRVYDGFGYVQFDSSSNVYIGSERHYSALYVYNKTYMRVYGDIYGMRSPLTINSTCSLVVDGSIYTRRSSSWDNAYYGTSTINTSGYVIVKGNMFDTAALTKSGSGVLIANTITASKNYSVSNGYTVTNQILNAVINTVEANTDSNGYFTFAAINSKNGKSAAVRNDQYADNYPYPVLSTYYALKANYQISGGTVALYGDYDTSSTVYDQTRKLMEGSEYTDNAVADVLKAMDVLDENGDLKASLRNTSLTTAQQTAWADAISAEYTAKVSEYGSDIESHECVQIGNSKYDGSSTSPCLVEVKQTGGTLYAAGNLTYSNDTCISGGTINCGGALSSKLDLTIKGGTINSKEIGNACTVVHAVNSSVNRYSETIISGGTITTDRIGQLSYDLNGYASKSTVLVSGTPTLKTSAQMNDNMYVNYICEDGYSVDASNPAEITYSKNLASGTLAMTGLTSASGDVSLVAPVGTPTAIWCYDSSSGTETNSISAEGYINGGTQECVYNRESINFYEAKESYTLIIREGDYVDAAFVPKNGGSSTAFAFNTAGATSDYAGYKIAQVPYGSTVTIEISEPEKYKKTVVWYTDASGVLRNAMPTCTEAGILTFTMPASDTEIYIADEMTLYLDKYDIAVTEDGFGVEAPSDTRRADALFDYEGDIRIKQTSTAVTYNRVYFESGCSNVDADGTNETRTITYDNLRQKLTGNTAGTQIAKSTNVKITMSGTNQIAPIDLPGKKSTSDTNGSSLILAGSDRAKDSLVFNVLQAFDSFRAIGYSADSTCGAVTFQNLKLSTSGTTAFVKCNSSSYKTSDVKFINCDMTSNWGSSYYMACYMKDVYVDNCNFTLTNSTSYTSYPFNCVNVYVSNGTTFKYTFGGQYNGYPFWSNVSGTVYIDDSSVSSLYNENASSLYINTSVLTGKIVLNNGTFTSAGQTRLVSLVMNGASTVNIGTDQKGYLLAEAVTVNDTSELNAGYVLIAGHSTALQASQDAFDTVAKTGTAFVNGSSKTGFVMNGGTANISEFVGGDYNGKVTVNAGTLNAKNIGTYGALFGYKTNIPAQGSSDFVYIYEKTPVKATVTVNGGDVNVLENGVLGGINSTVNLKGGTVTLADGAYIGISEEEQAEVEFNASVAETTVSNPSVVTIAGSSIEGTGSINAPYSTLNISGTDTAINVASICADGGDIVISDAATAAGTNPYTGQEKRKPANVGVIAETITADSIEIKNGASVYASSIETTGDGSNTASLIVESGYLSTDGGFTEAEHDDDNRYDATPNGDAQTVFGLKMVAITYVLDPEGVLISGDEENVVNDNISNYAVTSDARTIAINDASCAGYYFRGWYLDEDLTNPAGSTFNTSFANDITLYAKWEKVKVKIAVVIDGDSTTYDLTNEFTGTNWTDNGDGSYTSGNYAYVTYGDKILSATGVSYANYNTNKLGVTAFEYYENQSGKTITGSTSIIQGTTMSSEVAEIYKEISDNGTNDAVIKLHVASVQNLYAILKLVLNKKDGKPVDAAFTTTSSSTIEYSVSIDAMLKTVSDFSGDGTTKSPDLVTASATGYTFIGWNTDKDATADTEDGWLTGDSYIEETTTAYAIWQANTYRIRFTTTDGQWITVHNDRPAYGSDHRTSLDYYWVYDTPITEENSFWLIDEENLESMTELPFAWKEGYLFDQESGWSFSYIDGTGRTRTETITSASALSKVVIQSINTSTFDPDTQRPEEPGLVLTASYTKAKITYDLNGGSWNGTMTDTEYLEYSQPLRGVSQTATADSGNELVGTQVVDEDQLYYNVQSTTAAYYAAQGTYTDSDYRNVLYRKGYTFLGWYTSQDAANDPENPASAAYQVGSSPRFEDIAVYAGWKANDYSLALYSYDTTYDYVEFNIDKADYISGVDVTVGQEINSDLWPSRNGAWYAYNTGDDTTDENRRRFLLGFTFVGLNPGNSSQDSPAYTTYQKYARIITNLENDDTLFLNGTVFTLPEDAEYTEDVQSDTALVIPDYPNGSTINLYATYRERSLVFNERYIDPDGVEQQKVKYACAWNEWSDYADTYGEGSEEILEQGYSLVGWHVNGTTATAPEYPTIAKLGSEDAARAAYEADMLTYKTNAQDLGTYDINVYTVYVAQVENDIELDASEDPTSTADIVNTYVLPASMQKGILSLELTNDSDLKLVPRTEMEAHYYDSDYADDTVAVTATIKNGNVSYTYDLAEGTIDTEKMVAAGWTVELRLYHSKVMTEDATDGAMTLKLLFSDGTADNTLAQQFVQDNIQINLTASVYTVRCAVELPEAYSDLDVTDYGDFAGTYQATSTKMIQEFTRSYGDDIAVTKPEITGYTAEADWIYSDENAYSDVTMPVTASNNGVINVTTSYTAKPHKLTVSDDVLAEWTVTYTDGVDGTEFITYTDAVDVKFDSVIHFTKKSTDSVPQFVQVNGTKLDEMSETADSTVYTYQFGDEDETVTYCDVQTLYLEDGTIDITETGYTQNGETKTWPGNYVILQNKDNDASAATENVLNLAGDLSDRDISLGNLNISSNDSIAFSGAKAVLTETGTVTARNIAVPADSALTLNGNGADTKTTLTPASGRAGIGGNATDTQSGTINLNNTEIDMTLVAGSAASGIGSGSQDSTLTSGSITISDAIIKMKETAGTSAYTGSWIGGNGVSQVILSATTVERLDNSTNHTAGPSTIAGQTVKITNGSSIGTSASDSLYNPIYAENELDITDSVVYLTIQDNLNNNSLAKSPIGTGATGLIRIDQTDSDTAVQVTKAGIGSFEELYTGLMDIESAKADVVISDRQIVELSLGNVVITDAGVTQSGESHDHTGSYEFIQEGTVTNCDITVTSITDGKSIYFEQPTATADNANAVGNSCISIGNLDVEADVTVECQADLDIQTSFEANADLTVNAEGYTITLETDALDSEGSYTQNGGTIASGSAIGGNDLELTLKDVTVTAKSVIGKSLTIEGGTVTATEKVGSGADGEVQTVNFTEGAVITAPAIGAIGTEGDSFTFVNMDADVTFTGTVYRDLYRIAYDNSGLDLDDSALPKVYRDHETLSNAVFTEADATSDTAIPGNPAGDDADLFTTWYLFSSDGTLRNALQEDSYVKPVGISGVTQLSYATPAAAYAEDVTTNDDTTQTITVHAWAKTTGTAVITSGRQLQDFTTDAKTVTIENNKACTVKLTSTGSIIEDRDYYMTFTDSLPVGTALTLTQVGEEENTYYYYLVTASTGKVKFSDFAKCGTADEAIAMETSEDGDTFLISIDFADAQVRPTADLAIGIGIIPNGTDELSLVDDLKCSFTEVKDAVISCASDTLTIESPASGDSDLAGEKVMIKAHFLDSEGNEVTLDYDIEAKLGDATGVLVNKSTLLFDIGTYSALTAGSRTLSITGLDAGTYTIEMEMVYGAGERENVFRNVISNTADMTYTVESKTVHGITTLPWLTAETSRANIVLDAGTAETIKFQYLTSADSVTIDVKKMTSLGAFASLTDNTVTFTAVTGTYQGTETITFTENAAPGTYLIVFSINEETANDDVYFTYIVQ